MMLNNPPETSSAASHIGALFGVASSTIGYVASASASTIYSGLGWGASSAFNTAISSISWLGSVLSTALSVVEVQAALCGIAIGLYIWYEYNHPSSRRDTGLGSSQQVQNSPFNHNGLFPSPIGHGPHGLGQPYSPFRAGYRSGSYRGFGDYGGYGSYGSYGSYEDSLMSIRRNSPSSLPRSFKHRW